MADIYPFDDNGLSGDHLLRKGDIQERTSKDPLTKLYHQAREQGLSKPEARSAAFAAMRGVQPRQQEQQSQYPPGW
jgi:hypothetical protein